MKVFCLGLGKTGTTTFGEAMKKLGYRHKGFDREAIEDFYYKRYSKLYQKCLEADSHDDFPWPLMYQSLNEWFPNSKYVLTYRRDFDTWYKSLIKHVERGAGNNFHREIAYGITDFYRNKEYLRYYYNKHYSDVIQAIDNKKLLVVCWENGDGWKKLCNFLNVPVPDFTFPHENKKKRFKAVSKVKKILRNLK